MKNPGGAAYHAVRPSLHTADMIVNGYAFNRCTEGFRVLNLNHPDHAVVFSDSGKVLEISMDDIEIRIVGDYLEKNRKFMEEYDVEVL